jgi:predicted methyltransferase
MIEAIKRRVLRADVKNVVTVLGTELDPRLPAPVDAVLIVDSFHEMQHAVSILKNVTVKLKPQGRVGIVEFKKDGWGPGPDMNERVDPERVIRDADAAGLRLVSRETFLRYQYLLVFSHK